MSRLEKPEPDDVHVRASKAEAGPRIVYIDLLRAGALANWDELLGGYAELGFESALIAPPFLPGPDGSVFRLADLDRLQPALDWQGSVESGLEHLAGLCARHGMRPMLDLVLDQVAAGTPLSSAADGVFAPGPGGAPDPRTGAHGPDTAWARTQSAPDAERLGAFWGRHVGSWHDAGIAGFRLLGLHRLPGAALPNLLPALREHAHGATLLGWTAGMDWDVLPRLAGAGLDYVFSSFSWWDWRSDWIWQEWELLARVAPVIACPEAPYGSRLAGLSHDPAVLGPVYHRALGLAASLGNGWMMPAGFEHAVAEPMDERFPMQSRPRLDLAARIAAMNERRAKAPLLGRAEGQRLLTAPDAELLAVLRTDTIDARRAHQAALLLANTDLAHPRNATASALLPHAGTCFEPFTDIDDHARFGAGDEMVLAPGEVRVLTARATPVIDLETPLQRGPASAAAAAHRLAITGVSPAIRDSQRPVKRLVGETVAVEADILCEGHDQLGAVLLWRKSGDAQWQEQRMRSLGNDRWRAEFPVSTLGSHEFTIEAWHDAFATFRDELRKKHMAGVSTSLELREGRALVDAAATRERALQPVLTAFDVADEDQQRALLLSDEIATLMQAADDRPFRIRPDPPRRVNAERTAAGFGSWYELFPRSTSDDAARHGTFDDVIRHLPRIRDMGFDVLYFPPIHPIGHTNRKGRNNSLRAAPDDPGSPYAIGSEEGGHDAIHPALGSFADFARLQEAAAMHGLELALDFAIQCSPDHPWLRQHKDWFDWRPDGSLRYAENPPKKYEDIVNVDFYTEGAVPDLWMALCNVVLFWCSKGIRLFRVDNPHTKPFPFWEWLIAEVRSRHPDAIFLSEAFTRPKIMYRLAEIGFSQSYTYFTWRSTKQELRDYLEELTTTGVREYFRPHFFVNTPDINPVYLQTSGRPGFLIRAALAATLSGLWGVYNGFELCEGRPIPGREEYLDSEKYEIRAWDWNRPGNIVAEISRLNRIRRTNPALQTHLDLTFLDAWNDAVLFYEKATADRSNVVLVAVSLDPVHAQEADIDLPLWHWSLPDSASLDVEDLMSGHRFAWHGKRQHIRLTPEMPFFLWRARPIA